ncbi:M56 family metallopeptidase [Hufsiella ginkgonis]|uniref:Peptidase M56 domain-containing protein n=1 Tax=Hufsiella ginkgonis TaxID=2695274 RepID=A0A7K1XW94_9SPHI|nr:M56 family metallopeptidase [Hufsiella ginkgonis]MXV15262.1 hypothetical protein [Hufsiella ginkgonis]
MNLIYYMLEANTYLLVSWFFYRLALQRETFYTLNRFYLLGTTLLAFVMPSISLSGLRPAVAELPIEYAVAAEKAPGVPLLTLGCGIYLVVVLFFMARFVLRIYRISRMVAGASTADADGIKTVPISEPNLSFSFLNYLFIHPGAEKAETIIRHELVHIRQRHSLDILFFELVRMVNWINPLTVLIQQEIKAQHEFIADEVVANIENNAGDYALFLIHNSYGAVPRHPGSTMFSHSLLKKRIMKLNQKRSSSWARLKYLPVLVLLPSMLCVTATAFTKDYGMIDLMPADTIKNKSRQKIVPPPPPPAPPKLTKSAGNATKVSPSPPAGTPEAKARNEARFKAKGGKDVPPPPPPTPPVQKPEVEEVTEIPPPKVNQVRFPPPKAKSKLKTSPKVEQVRFPAPKLKSKKSPPKVDQVRFPPPEPKPPVKEKPAGSDNASKGKKESEPVVRRNQGRVRDAKIEDLIVPSADARPNP